ncbi:MAG: kynureninase [Pseudomonadota bacterium]|nr:kynureninase [Pseudomonadota bacterium]
MTEFNTTRECAKLLDRNDPLSAFRDRFNFPYDRNGQQNIYVCGNSLGLQPKIAVQYVSDVLSDWGSLGIEGHFRAQRPWMYYAQNAVAGFASLTGAMESEVVAMNTLTVNLHVLMASFYRPDDKRRKIVIESTAFPSDYYAVTSQLQLHGHDPAECLVEWEPREDELLYTEDLEKILSEQGDEIALLLLPGVQYYTGQVIDMAEACRLGQVAGCRVGLDLAHAIGNVRMSLHDWAPDFAAWCTYKYLNAGPGAVAGAFVHEKHLGGDGSNQLTGWWGNHPETRFRMARHFEPAPGAERWQLSNPPILALAPVVASLELFSEAGIDALCEKSQHQSAYLRFLLKEHFAGQVDTITPENAGGCQLSLIVSDSTLQAKDIFRALERLHVTGDWREPNVIRVAPVPLYNSFEDIYELSERLGTAIEVQGQN